MADTWGDDDDEDDWDVDDDDEIDAKLGLKKVEDALPTFDDEVDLTVTDKAAEKAASHETLKKKGHALAAKKKAEQERKEEIELAKKAMELEAEMEANMSPDERRALKQRQVEEADNALTDDLFGAVESVRGPGGGGGVGTVAAAGDKVKMKDIKDHLKHARVVAECITGHGKTHLAVAYLKESIEQCKSVLDDAAVSELIKVCNVIKNEKVQAAKRKVKGQAQKSKKADKQAERILRQKQIETFGDNDEYDKYDEMGHNYEDDFF